MQHIKNPWTTDSRLTVADLSDQQVEQKIKALAFLDCLSLVAIHSTTQKLVTRQVGNDNGDKSKG